LNSAPRAIDRFFSAPAVLAGLTLALIWSYGSTLAELASQWSSNPQHSHGYLVPLFAIALLYLRRDRFRAEQWSASAWGVLPLLAGLGAWMAATHFHLTWIEGISLLPCLAGIVILMGGRQAWRWAWPAIGFLAFMVPLPYRAAVALTDPLQRTATLASTYALQTLGLPAVAEGNVILLSEVELGVVEACSGLRMLVIFFALAAGVALVIRRPLWEKAVVLLSAVPIAIIVNVIRITATGVLHELVGREVANAVFHDFAGWVMMPLALALLWLELRILARLFLEPLAPTGPTRLGTATMRAAPVPS
jgi:exosortase